MNTINNNNSEYGYLEVQVFTATGGIPISNAQVTITKGLDKAKELINVLYTNRNGKTDVIKLPAPPKENSLTPQQGKEIYSIYNIKTVKEGFITVENINVAIFSGQRSIQPVNMLPLDELNEKSTEIYEQEPNDL